MDFRKFEVESTILFPIVLGQIYTFEIDTSGLINYQTLWLDHVYGFFQASI